MTFLQSEDGTFINLDKVTTITCTETDESHLQGIEIRVGNEEVGVHVEHVPLFCITANLDFDGYEILMTGLTSQEAERAMNYIESNFLPHCVVLKGLTAALKKHCEEPRFSREEPRFSREEPRFSREEPRFSREEPRFSREEPRFSREEPRFSPTTKGRYVNALS